MPTSGAARLAGGGGPSDEQHAIVAAVLAGAEGVESADIAEGAEGILDALLAAHPEVVVYVGRNLKFELGLLAYDIDSAFAIPPEVCRIDR